MRFIRTMLRWTRHVLLGFSLFAFLATMALWARSYWVADELDVQLFPPTTRYIAVSSGRCTMWMRSEPASPRCIYWVSRPPQVQAQYCTYLISISGGQHYWRFVWGGLSSPGLFDISCILEVPMWTLSLLTAVPPVLWLLWWRKRRPVKQRGFPVVTSPVAVTRG